jgi:hypothetical protein
MAERDQEEGGRGAMLPPYIAFQSLKTFVQNLKPHKLPGRIDRSLLQNFAGTVQGQLITTLRFFALIDAKGIPNERLETLVQAYDTDQWPTALAGLLLEKYSAVFEIGLATASPGQFNERFRSAFGGAENVQRKSMTFFLNAARDAQIEISEHITKNKKPRSAGTTGRRRSIKSARTNIPTQSAHTPPPSHTGNGSAQLKAPNAYELLAVLDMSDMEPAEQAAVWTLIQYLKRKEAGIAAATTKQRREKLRPAAAVPVTEAEGGS